MQYSNFLSLIKLLVIVLFISVSSLCIHAQSSLDNSAYHETKDTLINSKVKLSIGGQMRVNGIYDFNALQELEAFNILSIPTGSDYNNSPRFSLGVNQSRLNLSLSYYSKTLGPVKSYFEGDFWGNDFLNFRLRHFYVDIKNFRIGRSWSLFCDEEAWPDIIDFDGPPTGLWARATQVRYTNQIDESNKLAFAIESPQTDITPIAHLDSTISETYQGFPDLTAHWSNSGNWGHFQLSVIYRQLYYLKDESNTLSNSAGGVSLSGHIRIRNKDKLILQGTAGSGIASYLVSFMGGGYDAVTETNGVLSNVPVFGGYAAYELWLTNNLKSTWVYGQTHLTSNIDDFTSDSFEGYYFSGNFFWLLDDKMSIGIEGQYGHVNNFYNENGEATRLQTMFIFNF